MKPVNSLILFLVPITAAGMTPEEFIKASPAAYARLKDYTCVMNRIERVGNRLIEQRNIRVKFRKPMSVYLKWTEGDFKGSESIFSIGRYNDKLRFHYGGWRSFLRVSLAPRSSLAMKNNRHSIDETPFGHVLDLIVENVRRAGERGEGKIVFKGETTLEGEAVLEYEGVFPEGKGYYGRLVRLWADSKTLLPAKVEVLGWKDELLEMYRYSDVRPDVGLTDEDFDVKNSAYGF